MFWFCGVANPTFRMPVSHSGRHNVEIQISFWIYSTYYKYMAAMHSVIDPYQTVLLLLWVCIYCRIYICEKHKTLFTRFSSGKINRTPYNMIIECCSLYTRTSLIEAPGTCSSVWITKASGDACCCCRIQRLVYTLTHVFTHMYVCVKANCSPIPQALWTTEVNLLWAREHFESKESESERLECICRMHHYLMIIIA